MQDLSDQIPFQSTEQAPVAQSLPEVEPTSTPQVNVRVDLNITVLQDGEGLPEGLPYGSNETCVDDLFYTLLFPFMCFLHFGSNEAYLVAYNRIQTKLGLRQFLIETLPGFVSSVLTGLAVAYSPLAILPIIITYFAYYWIVLTLRNHAKSAEVAFEERRIFRANLNDDPRPTVNLCCKPGWECPWSPALRRFTKKYTAPCCKRSGQAVADCFTSMAACTLDCTRCDPDYDEIADDEFVLM